MEREAFIARALKEAQAKGCAAAEVYYSAREAFSAGALNGELERYTVSRSGGISVRVQVDGRDGYAYTEHLEDPETLVERAMDNAACLSAGEEHPFQTKQVYQTLEQPVSPLDSMSEGEKIALSLALEKEALAADPRVKRTAACSVGAGAGEMGLVNTCGLAAFGKRRSAYCYVEPVVEENGQVQTGFAFRMGPTADDIAGCAQEAVADALSRLGGKPVPSGAYRVLLKNKAVGDLLRAFSPMFSAEQAQKGCSLLAGKEGQSIASNEVTLMDDPFDPMVCLPFDGEGTACYPKAIIDGGRLNTLLHNLKTARKAGVVTTGNAVRGAGSMEVAPASLTLAPGTLDYPGLLEKLGDGLVITELEGLHAGVNVISGDFSLKASGRLIKGGKDVGAASQITVAGTFLNLLRDVETVGADTVYGSPSGLCVKCPSILIKTLQVAGKAAQ